MLEPDKGCPGALAPSSDFALKISTNTEDGLIESD